MLGIPPEVIEGYGAVSETVARRMAEGAWAPARVDLALSCTGIAGPGGAASSPATAPRCARRPSPRRWRSGWWVGSATRSG
jgi:hypothetical protein